MRIDDPWLVCGGILGLAVLVGGLAVGAVGRVAPPPSRGRHTGVAALVLVAWMALTGALAVLGVWHRFELRPPPLVFLMVGSLALGLGLGFSPAGARLGHRLPLAALVGFQGFRLPLELVMHQAAIRHIMPMEMSFAGRNFDIVTGASAIGVAAWLAWHRPSQSAREVKIVVAVWNVMGIATLINVLVVALLATPLIHAFGTDPDHLNTWVAEFPYVWLPAVLVAAAVAGHVVISRCLLARQST